MNTKLYPSSNLLGNILLLFLLFVGGQVIAQTPPPVPAACVVGNADDLGSIQAFSNNCTDFGEQTANLPVSFSGNGKNYTNVKFYFSVPSDFDLLAPTGATAVNGQLVSGSWIANSNLVAGFHYVMATAEENGVKRKKCQLVEILDTSKPPAIGYSICDPSNIEITIKDDPSNIYEKYEIDWGGIGNIQTIKKEDITLPYTFTGPNTGAEVSITGLYVRFNVDRCPSVPFIIDPSSPNVPFINYLELIQEGSGALIKFENFEVGKDYKLEFSADDGSGVYNWSTSGDLKDGSGNIAGLDKSKNYCFRLGATDKCGGLAYSSIICSSNLMATQSGSQSANLEWNRPSEPNTIATKLVLLQEIVGCTAGPSLCTNRPYTDVLAVSKLVEGFDCQNTYTFQVTYTFKNADGHNITIKSDVVAIDPKGASVSIKPLDLVTAGFMVNDEKTIRIIVDRSDGEKYNFFRSNAYSNDFNPIGSVSDNTIDDTSIDPNANGYCYKYEFEDVCQVLSQPSPEFCTVFLTGNSSRLSWTPYTLPSSIIGDSPNVEYYIDYFDNNVNTWISRFQTKGTSQGIFDLVSNSKESELKFRVLARQYVTSTVSSGQYIDSYSNTVVINLPPNVFLPTAFTPNGDGINDTFKVYQKFIRTSTFVVYDRWGAILFETDSPEIDWDGMYNKGNKPVPAGNYAYRIQGESDAGEKFSKTGTITLIR